MKASSDVILVVMAGGSGTRFWPKSTSKKPKQFLSFFSNESLLKSTLNRFEGIALPQNRWISTTVALSQLSQAEGGEQIRVLAEPEGRNTAPCLYWAAQEAVRTNPNALMLIMPSDHYIPKLQEFKNTVQEAIEWAKTHDDLVTLGVKPTRPETGYGYLHVGESLSANCKKVLKFVEKPDLKNAQKFVNSGDYFWNGGMFVWRAEILLRAFDLHMPEMKAAWNTYVGDIKSVYSKLTATSIDYGIMEKASNVVTFSLDCGWDDLGSWTSLESLGKLLGLNKEAGVLAQGECISIDSKNNIIDTAGKTVALLGVENLIIVDSGGVLLVASKSRAQEIKEIVDKVKKENPSLA